MSLSRLISIVIPGNLLHVEPGFANWRHSLVSFHPVLSGIRGRQRQGEVALETVEQRAHRLGPPLILSAGKRSCTFSQAAVRGITCIKPWARLSRLRPGQSPIPL